MSLSIVVLLTTRRNYAIKKFLKMFLKINHYKKLCVSEEFYIKLNFPRIVFFNMNVKKLKMEIPCCIKYKLKSELIFRLPNKIM